MICTFKDCQKEAVHSEKDKNGNKWANLCDEHHEKLNRVCVGDNVKEIMSTWVKANGGAKKMAQKMTADIKKSGFFEKMAEIAKRKKPE